MNAVNFGIIFFEKNKTVSGSTNIKHENKEELKSIKPVVFCCFKNLEAYRILEFGDLILKKKKKKITNMYEFLIARDKLKWNSFVKLKIKRGRKNLDLKVKLKSFAYWKKNFPRLGFEIIKKKGSVEVSNTSILSSIVPKFDSPPSILKGDKIVSISVDRLNFKINSLRTLANVLDICIPKEKIKINILRDGKLYYQKFTVISFEEFLKLNREFCYGYWPKQAAKILLKKYEENDFYLDLDYKMKIIKKYSDDKYKKSLFSIAKKGINKGRFKLSPKGRKYKLKLNS